MPHLHLLVLCRALCEHLILRAFPQLLLLLHQLVESVRQLYLSICKLIDLRLFLRKVIAIAVLLYRMYTLNIALNNLLAVHLSEAIPIFRRIQHIPLLGLLNPTIFFKK